VRISLIGLPLAAVCLAGSVAACSGPGPAEGTVAGHLYGVGGPATISVPPSARAWPGTVILVGSGVHVDVSVGANGTFSVVVPVGRYTVTGHSPRFGSGTYLCQAAGVVTVTSGHTTKADVLCQMA
jgi:hypothetical protein